MKQLILLTAVFMISTVTLADDTTATEICADGAGTIITGAVSGHKYCKSKNRMNWWNAVAWCDTQGRRLFDRSDCACGNTTADCANSKCPDLNGIVAQDDYIWATPIGSSATYQIRIPLGVIQSNLRSNSSGVLCF